MPSPEVRERRRANLENRITEMITTAHKPRRKSFPPGACANHNKSIQFTEISGGKRHFAERRSVPRFGGHATSGRNSIEPGRHLLERIANLSKIAGPG